MGTQRGHAQAGAHRADVCRLRRPLEEIARERPFLLRCPLCGASLARLRQVLCISTHPFADCADSTRSPPPQSAPPSDTPCGMRAGTSAWSGQPICATDGGPTTDDRTYRRRVMLGTPCRGDGGRRGGELVRQRAAHRPWLEQFPGLAAHGDHLRELVEAATCAGTGGSGKEAPTVDRVSGTSC